VDETIDKADDASGVRENLFQSANGRLVVIRVLVFS